MNEILILCAAYLVDRVVGDPRSIPHPVIGIGWCISRLERGIRIFAHTDRMLKLAGLLFPIVIVGGSYLAVWLLHLVTERIHPWLSVVLEIWLISTTLATKGLGDAGLQIYQHLIDKQIGKARYALSMVVGRDTDRLDEPEICRGAVETVAENIVDAIVSPLFYAAIGGAPLAMAYRAVNTLDSMVGYKNEKYLHLGWASARLDDGANYLPARLTAFLLVMASYLTRTDYRRAWKTIRRDARKHPSPNSGFPEAGVAGALGIQLGGLNYYKGIASRRAQMGEPLRPLQSTDIIQTIQLMRTTSLLALLAAVSILWAWPT